MSQYEYAFATPAELGGHELYLAWCAAAGVTAVEGGYGVLMVDDTFTGRATLLTEDVGYVRTLVAAAKTEGGFGGLQIPPGVFTLQRSGWPDEWTA
ncbi:hypothetical protein [Streptomyces sp. CBMA29]|uniref:hypothetical protein n=1 Tax=Streptomyces sp. CBMA29 TaxID=1896314 RepID=UPI001661C0E7|nr:hypothetical protein [Streptomyces sp. CBMA29]